MTELSAIISLLPLCNCRLYILFRFLYGPGTDQAVRRSWKWSGSVHPVAVVEEEVEEMWSLDTSRHSNVSAAAALDTDVCRTGALLGGPLESFNLTKTWNSFADLTFNSILDTNTRPRLNNSTGALFKYLFLWWFRTKWTGAAHIITTSQCRYVLCEIEIVSSSAPVQNLFLFFFVFTSQTFAENN